MYVADGNNKAIRKISPTGQVSTLVGGARRESRTTWTAVMLRAPSGVAVDKEGVVYVADPNSNAVLKVNGKGELTVFAGNPNSEGGSVDGLGAQARFNHPTSLAISPDGTVYITDQYNATVRKISPQAQVSTLAGEARKFASSNDAPPIFGSLAGIAVDKTGTVYVSEEDRHTIRKISPQGTVTTLAGQANASGSADGKGSAARFKNPAGLALDAQGNLYVTEAGNNTLRRITPAGVVTTLLSPGSGTAHLSIPAGVAVGADGAVYVADRGNSVIRVLR